MDCLVSNRPDGNALTVAATRLGAVADQGQVKTDELDPQAEARRRLALAQIRQYPDPVLRLRSHEVEAFDADLAQLVDRMARLMQDASGVGLAATQVGVLNRVLVYRVHLQSPVAALVNPEIEWSGKESETMEEGCLSLPGLYGQVMRPKQVRINAYSLEGKEIQTDATGLFARCVQHELDHLDGVLFPDRMSPTAKADIAEGLAEFESEFRSLRETGGVANDEDIQKRWADWEARYA